MTDVLTFFSDEKELTKLTGLNYDELWKEGFVLDDMDWGFVIDEEYDEFIVNEEYPEFQERGINFDKYYRGEIPSYIYQLFRWMDQYCVGYHHTEYNGKHYYTLHHA